MSPANANVYFVNKQIMYSSTKRIYKIALVNQFPTPICHSWGKKVKKSSSAQNSFNLLSEKSNFWTAHRNKVMLILYGKVNLWLDKFSWTFPNIKEQHLPLKRTICTKNNSTDWLSLWSVTAGSLCAQFMLLSEPTLALSTDWTSLMHLLVFHAYQRQEVRLARLSSSHYHNHKSNENILKFNVPDCKVHHACEIRNSSKWHAHAAKNSTKTVLFTHS